MKKTSKSTKSAKTAVKKEEKQDDVVVVNQPKAKSYRPWIIAGVIIAVLAIAGLWLRQWLTVATVNGQPISRIEIIRELEQQYGQEAIDAAITKRLIMQEAQKQNVTISDEEIQAEIDEISQSVKAQGQELEQILTLQGTTMENLKEQIRIQKFVEKMAGDQVEVTDEEVQTYIKDNKELFPANLKPEEISDSAKQQLRDQKISQAIRSWLQNIKDQADIQYRAQ